MSDEIVKVVGVTDTMGEPVLSRTTLEMIAKRRQAAGRLVAGLAATASSDDFKDAVGI